MPPADPQGAARPAVVAVCGPLTEQDVQLLCDRVAVLLLGECHARITCDVGGGIDLSVVDALARLQLIAQRAGACLDVQSTGDALPALLALTGLEIVATLGLQPLGQPEAGE